jgi:hypothetical protein
MGSDARRMCLRTSQGAREGRKHRRVNEMVRIGTYARSRAKPRAVMSRIGARNEKVALGLGTRGCEN